MSRYTRITTEPPVGARGKTVPEFCRAWRFSIAFYYGNLRKSGKGPREMKAGARTIISTEAEDAWRREREADAEKRLKAIKAKAKAEAAQAPPRRGRPRKVEVGKAKAAEATAT